MQDGGDLLDLQGAGCVIARFISRNRKQNLLIPRSRA